MAGYVLADGTDNGASARRAPADTIPGAPMRESTATVAP